MAVGKLEKYYKEYVLSEQIFIKDSSITISDLAKKISKSCGGNITIKSFVSLQLRRVVRYSAYFVGPTPSGVGPTHMQSLGACQNREGTRVGSDRIHWVSKRVRG